MQRKNLFFALLNAIWVDIGYGMEWNISIVKCNTEIAAYFLQSNFWDRNK